MNDVKKSEISGPAFSRKWDGFEKKVLKMIIF